MLVIMAYFGLLFPQLFALGSIAAHRDGWVPVPREQVYNVLQTHYKLQNMQANNEVVSPSGGDVFQVVHPEVDQILTKGPALTATPGRRSKAQQDAKELGLPQKKNIGTENFDVRRVLEKIHTNTEKCNENLFKASINELSESPVEIDSLDEADLKIKLNHKYEESENVFDSESEVKPLYEVTENYKSANRRNEEDNDEPRVVNLRTTNDLTSKFYDIISKYNIKPNDDLQNYDLSRKTKRTNSKYNYIDNVVIPYTYQTSYFLAGDPLLTTLMSHYLHYRAPYEGRVNSRYLYGHAATNTEPYSKQFGLYELSNGFTLH